MENRTKSCVVFIVALLIAAVVFLVGKSYLSSLSRGGKVAPIPNSPLQFLAPESEEFTRYHPLGTSAAIAHAPIPGHPFMAAKAGNNMHCDAYMSDTYQASGPLGIAPQVYSRTQGFGGYGTIAFDRYGRLVAVYSNARVFQLELMDPDTLEELASFDLPPRPWYFPLQGVMPWEYIGAGMYFYLDDQGRAIVPTTLNTIQVIQVPGPESGAEFELVREYDLAGDVVPRPWPKQDSVAWVLPDWSGKVYWYATTEGMVGVVDVDSGDVRTLRLEGEMIENSFGVAEEGVFILSDYALYRFSLNPSGDIQVDWRTEYDRGSQSKPGHITRGSGTSVTIMGDLDGYVTVTDNAEPRINLEFIRRSDGAIVCSQPLFEDGKSGTDISLIGFEGADESGAGSGVYSVLVENNWGHHRFPFAYPEPGIARVDLTRDPSGAYRCEEIWMSGEKNIGVFKLSLGNGLVYLYFRGNPSPVTQWYFTALDFVTGETVYKRLTGVGLGYNNWAGSIFIHPDGGVAYSTTIFGLVMMKDEEP